MKDEKIKEKVTQIKTMVEELKEAALESPEINGLVFEAIIAMEWQSKVIERLTK